MIKKIVLLQILLFALSIGVVGQTRLGVYAAGFYNLENLFDTEDDPDNSRTTRTLLPRKWRTAGYWRIW